MDIGERRGKRQKGESISCYFIAYMINMEVVFWCVCVCVCVCVSVCVDACVPQLGRFS